MNHSNNIFFGLIKEHGRLRVLLFSSFAFCILVVSLAFFALSMGKPYMGIMLSMTAQGWVVEKVDATGLAIQAGIREGDKPIEIDGQPAETFLEKYKKAGVVFGMSIGELTVSDDRGQLKSVAVKDSSPSWQSVTELTTWLVTCLISWIIGFYVFLKRPRNATALLLCLCGLVSGLALSSILAAERAIPPAPQLSVVASVIGPWLLLHFFLILPEERAWLRNNPLVYLIYLPAAITLVLFPLVGYAEGQPLLWFRSVRLFEYGVGFLSAVGMVVFDYFHTASTKTRQQMKIVLISCLTALVPFLVLSLLPEAIWGQSILPPGFGILFIVFIPLGMGYAVVTQKLMDIDVVVRRGVIYGLVTLVMAAILSAGIVAVMVFQDTLGIPEEIAIALALGAVASVLFGPTKKGIEILVDKLFYKDRYDYRQIIQSMSISLRSLKDFVDISRLIVGTTVNTLNLAGGCLFTKSASGSFEVSAGQGTFADPHKQRQLAIIVSQVTSSIEFPNSASTTCSDLAFLIPLLAGDRKVGILCLSQKASRQGFSPDDLYLLQGLASVAAMALYSAMLIRDVSIRDTFVSVASHELRTPLTSIRGYAELLLLRNPPEATRRKWLKNIFDNSQRLSNMVDDLLNVSRIQTGRMTIKLERANVSTVFAELLYMAKESSDKHEFVIDIEPRLPDVLVDRARFGQVLGNLVSNAVKYSPNGGRITLSAHHDPQRHRVVVSVADEGIGIGPEDRDSLFTTFHRIQRPETQSVRGSGLGLYIAKEWTQAMGGEIWLESELNKGSTFFVAVPTQASKRAG